MVAALAPEDANIPAGVFALMEAEISGMKEVRSGATKGEVGIVQTGSLGGKRSTALSGYVLLSLSTLT